MKQLIRDIQNRLKTEIPALAYVEMNCGQLNKADNLPATVAFPAALIDIVKAEYSNEGKLRQIGTIEIGISVIDHSDFDDQNAQNNLFDRLTEINRALHGWSGSDHYGLLNKTSLEQIKREDDLLEYRIIFRVQLVDTSAERRTIMTSATMGIIHSNLSGVKS
ncbi:MAG: hypothetical protein FWF54_04525 [Candidatus Azobacteroides sp.]|nr:hypothetical protein [Candidatus Azobacteroides sp.]